MAKPLPVPYVPAPPSADPRAIWDEFQKIASAIAQLQARLDALAAKVP
jgi:hypothetical protein